MFENALAIFGLSKDKNREGALLNQLRTAVAIILVAAAKADDDFDDTEYEFISKSLSAKLQIPKAKIGELIAVAATEEDGRVLEAAVQLIRSEFSVEHRQQLLALVWSVIEADSTVAREESTFAVNLRDALDLSLEQALAARKRAEHFSADGVKGFLEASDELAEATKAWMSRRAEQG